MSMATRDRPGTNSFNNSNRFASSSPAREESPVTFAAGCDRLDTTPLSMASPTAPHHNGNRCSGLLRGEHRLGAPSENDVYFEANQIVRQLRKSLIAPSCIAVLETHVFSLDIAEITENLSKGIDGRQRFERQDTDGDYFPRLLRARRERPRGRAAEQRDELAPSYVGHGLLLA